MKKILGISLVAVLTAMPLMAGADPVGTGTTPAHDDNAVAATAVPGYALAEANANDTNFATAGYVKGAYNAAIKAVNKTSVDAKAYTDTAVSTINNTTSGLETRMTAAEGSITTLTGNAETEGSVAKAEADAKAYTDAEIADLDANLSQTAAAGNGQLALTLTEVDGVVTGISGSITPNTYDAYGAAATAKTEAIEAAAADATTKADAAKAYADGLVTNQATKAGVEATVSGATTSGTASLPVTFGTITTNTSALTVAVPTKAAYNVMETWGSDAATPKSLDLGTNSDVSVAGTATTTIGDSTANGTVNTTVGTVTYNPGA